MKHLIEIQKVIYAGLLSTILLLAMGSQAMAQTATDESVHLSVILRQLDAIDHSLSNTSAAKLHRSNSRYHFDYQRARQDIKRIRSGIKDYISPQRAQPRDPVEIHGDYTFDKGSTR